MKESAIQQKIVKYLKTEQDACVYKTAAISNRGFPDLTAVLPGNRVLFIEVKTDTGRTSPLQDITHRDLRGRGAEVVVARSVLDIKNYLEVGIVKTL